MIVLVWDNPHDRNVRAVEVVASRERYLSQVTVIDRGRICQLKKGQFPNFETFYRARKHGRRAAAKSTTKVYEDPGDL